MNDLTRFIPQEVLDADVLLFSDSGGKDSHAAKIVLKRMGLWDKVILIHADLGEMEWEPMHNWIEQTSWGKKCNVVRSKLDFFDIVRKYGRFPSSGQQFCTDMLKTAPIKEWLHQYMYDNNLTTAVNITGMRAEESLRRAKKSPFILSKGEGTSKMHMVRKHKTHTIYDWMPVFYYTTEEVFEEIALAGHKPHAIYTDGKYSRLSCAFCINGRINEHKETARRRPELVAKMAKLEREIGKSFRLRTVKGKPVKRYLDEYVYDEDSKPRKTTKKAVPAEIMRFPNYLGSYLADREVTESFAV